MTGFTMAFEFWVGEQQVNVSWEEGLFEVSVGGKRLPSFYAFVSVTDLKPGGVPALVADLKDTSTKKHLPDDLKAEVVRRVSEWLAQHR